MDLKLEIFIHGVPLGQDIWGPQEADRAFLENFYGRNTNVEAQLLVDVKQFEGRLNCYYTYLRTGNILNKEKRSGSYFAISVRVNAYYADLANMYHILDAAYQKLILGVVLENNGTTTSFIFGDFSNVDKELALVSSKIQEYIGSFSIGSDLISLSGFVANGKSTPQNVNLLESNRKDVLENVKKNGSISVSPLYPTFQFLDSINKKNEEINSTKLEMQQQIADEKKKSAQEIQNIRNEYKDVNKTISNLDHRLDVEQKSVAELKANLQRSKDKLIAYETINQKLNSKEKEFNDANKMLTDIKQLIAGFKGHSGGHEIALNHKPEHKGQSSRKSKSYFPIANMIITVLIFLLVLYLVFQVSSKQTSIPTKFNNDETTSPVDQVNNQPETNNHVDNTVNSTSSEPQDLTKQTVNIDIVEFNSKDTIMIMGKNYQVRTKPLVETGAWSSKDFTIIKKNVISPKHRGTCKIDYLINDQVAGSRKITVK